MQDQYQDEDCPICCLDPLESTNGIVATFECNHMVCVNCFYKTCVLAKSQQCPLCKQESKQIFIHNIHQQIPNTRHINNSLWKKDNQFINAFVQNEQSIQDFLENMINPPCQICNQKFNNFHELQYHIESNHHLQFCNSCLRSAKFLPSEQQLYDKQQLFQHLKTHMKCPLCKRMFYDDEEFKEHLVNHRKCELCKQLYGISDSYFIDDNQLKQHYKEAHYTCPYGECTNNMIAFPNEQELAKHMIQEHYDKLTPKELTRYQLQLDEQRKLTIDMQQIDQYTQQYSLKALMAQPKHIQVKQQPEEINDGLGYHYETYIEPPVQYQGLTKKKNNNTNKKVVVEDHLTDDTTQNVATQHYYEDDDIVIKKKPKKTNKKDLNKIQQEREQIEQQIREQQQADQGGQIDFLQDIMKQSEDKNIKIPQKQPGISIQKQQIKEQPQNIQNNQNNDDLIVVKKNTQKKTKQQIKQELEEEMRRNQEEVQKELQLKQGQQPQQQQQQPQKQKIQYIKIQQQPQQPQQPVQQQKQQENEDSDIFITKKQKKDKRNKQQTNKQQQPKQQQIQQSKIEIVIEQQPKYIKGKIQFAIITSNTFSKQLNKLVCYRFVDNTLVEEMIWTEQEINRINGDQDDNFNIQNIYLPKEALNNFLQSKQFQITNKYQNKCKTHQFYEYDRKQIQFVFAINKQDCQILQTIQFDQNCFFKLPNSLINKKQQEYTEDICRQQLNQVDIQQVLDRYDYYLQKYQQQNKDRITIETQDEDSLDLPPGLY